MVTAQVKLTPDEIEALRAMAERTGRTEEQLLREAVQKYLTPAQGDDRLALLRQGKGIWKDRSDLPDHRQLRAELDRS